MSGIIARIDSDDLSITPVARIGNDKHQNLQFYNYQILKCYVNIYIYAFF